ncbi:MAG: histidine phosphatase family protein, partial [Clostridiales bacterium]|nr:histidine phosphatase family protein [Clostridiales bacterium]
MVNKDYISLTEPKYPEYDEEVHVYDRVKRTLIKIQERYSGSILIVGHGASVYQSARVLMDPPEGISVDMCAVNKFVRGNSGWILEFAGTEHLSSP